jgi:trans-aconitate methyltransferase
MPEQREGSDSAANQFGLSHHAYRQFRPAYPDEVYTRVLLALDPPHARAVDLGAGTGLVCAVLTRHFAHVTAVEHDPEMATHIHALAPSVEIMLASAERAEFEPGSLDLVTCANAFHWMQGPVVAGRVAHWLRRGGVFAGWRYPMPQIPAAVADLLADELARWLQFRDPRSLDQHSLRESFAAQPELDLLSEQIVEHPVTLDADGLLGFLRSVSFIAAFLRSLAPEAVEHYLAELGERLQTRLGAEQVVLEFPLTLVLARKR